MIFYPNHLPPTIIDCGGRVILNMRKKYFILIGTAIFGIAISYWLIVPSIYFFNAWGFIRSNIEFHYSIKRTIIDPKGSILYFDPYSYNDLYSARSSLDSLLHHNHLIYEKVPDIVAIPEKKLWDHVYRSFHVWKHSSFDGHVSYKQFREFILPYRAGMEPWSDYTDVISHRYSRILGTISNKNDPVLAAKRLNGEIKNWLSFDFRSHAELNEPDILQISQLKHGSCNSLAQFMSQICRNFGIPVAIDECPFWAHRNSGHAWNVVLDTTGKWIPFSAADKNPYDFRVVNDSMKVPKIYRRLFSKNPMFQPPFKTLNELPSLFRVPNYKDVTGEYVSTSEVSVRPDSSLTKGKSVLYLAVFNGDQWCIVAWSRILNGQASFSSLGNDSIVYLPVIYQNGLALPAASPFILTHEHFVPIIVDTANRYSVDLPLYNKFYAEDWKIGFPEENWELELFYWDRGWISSGKAKTNSKRILNFANVPFDALYLLRFSDRENTWQRIFQIKNGSQIWY